MAVARVPLVVIKRPRTLVAECGHAELIVKQLGENPALYPAPTPSLAVVSAHCAEFRQSLSDVMRGVVTKATREEKRTVVKEDIDGLREYVQSLVRANPDNAAKLAEMAGMALRKPRAYKKPIFDSKRVALGGVRLVVRTVKGARAYEWSMSTNGTSFDSLPPTTRASTTVTGLTPATQYFFRFRAVTAAGVTDWSAPYPVIAT